MLRPDGLRLLFAFAAGVVFATLALPGPQKGGSDHVLTSLRADVAAARAVTGEHKQEIVFSVRVKAALG